MKWKNDDGSALGMAIAIGVIIVLIIAIILLFSYSWNASCGKSPAPSCNCNSGNIPAECVCSCMKPVRECSCEERIKNIDERIKFMDTFVTDRKKELDAGKRPDWVPPSGGTPNTANSSGSTTVKAGGVTSSNVPSVDPAIAKRSCKDVVEGLCLHEQTHIDYNTQNGQCSGPLTWLSSRLSDSKANALQDESEFLSYSLEQNFLIKRQNELKQECNVKWKCRCTQELFDTSAQCAGTCPHASFTCIAPTCIQVKFDEEKGDWVWNRVALPG